MTLWLGFLLLAFLFFAPSPLFIQMIHYAKKWMKSFRWESRCENGKKLYFLLSSPRFLTERLALPRYKDFSSQVELLRSKQLETGVGIKAPLEKLRVYLKKDLAITQSLEREQREATFQSIMMIGISWIFVVIYTFYLSMETNIVLMSLCGGYQLLGLVFQYRLVFVLQKKKTASIEKISQKMVFLLALSKSGISLNSILKQSQLEELSVYKNGELKIFLDQFESLMNDWKSQGHPIEKALENLIDDLSFFYEQKMQSFMTRTKVLNSFFVALFVLPVFFILSVYPLLELFSLPSVAG